MLMWVLNLSQALTLLVAGLLGSGVPKAPSMAAKRALNNRQKNP